MAGYEDDSVSPEEGDEAPESGPGEDDHLTVCGRAIREAIASGDDRAVGETVRDAIRRYGADDEDDAVESDEDKPNLAAFIMGKAKGGKKKPKTSNEED